MQLEKPAGGQFNASISAGLCQSLCTGITLKDGHAAATGAWPLDDLESQAQIARLGEHPGRLPPHRDHASRWFALTLTSGRNHIVRRLCAGLGHPVLRLVRTRIGPIELGALQAGESRSERWERRWADTHD